MLFYRNLAKRVDIDVAFWREDGPALEHETCFRTLGGPELVGSRVLATQAADSGASTPAAEDKGADEAAPSAPFEQKPDGQVPTSEGAATLPQVGTVETVQSVLCHERPALLKKALLSSQRRLLIISPWIRHQVVNWEFIASLEALLRRGVVVHFGYGMDDGEAGGRGNAAQNKIPITPQAERDLTQLVNKHSNFKLVYVGNTHRKFLVSDDTFAVTTSFNWLSFKGDPRDRPRDEYGEVFRKKEHVDKRYELGIALLEKGYAGPGAGASRTPRATGTRG